MRAYVDANAVIALWHGPDHVHHDRALSIFRRVAGGELDLTVTSTVIAEIVWYCERRLGWPRPRIVDALGRLLAADGIASMDRTIGAAVALFGSDRRLDFVDAHVVACAVEYGPSAVVSFDRAFDRVAGLTRIGS